MGFLLYFERVSNIKTAQEYIEKYRNQITSGDMEKTALGARMLLKDLASDMTEMSNTRRIKKPNAAFILLCETNAKWNRIAAAFEKELGKSPLKKDGFRTWYEKALRSTRNGENK